MKVTVPCNKMSALTFVVLCVTISRSFGAFAPYQLHTQSIAAPYVPLPVPQPPLHFTPAQLPQHYYSPPGNTYSGFSYQTNYPDGGSSQVVFVTGPQARELMKQSIESFRQYQPNQGKLGIVSVTPSPNSRFHVLTVEPPKETRTTPATPNTGSNSASGASNPEAETFTNPSPLSNSLPLSTPNTVFPGIPQASVYRVQVFPSHVHQIPQFVHTPFPYHPIFASFYNTDLRLKTNNSIFSEQQEQADEAQESMIREVGAIPNVLSNNIHLPITTIRAVTDTQSSSTVAPLQISSDQTSSSNEISSPVATTNTTQLSSFEVEDTTNMEIRTTTTTPETPTSEASSANIDIGNGIQEETSTPTNVGEGSTSENVSSESGSFSTITQETTPALPTADTLSATEQTTQV